MCRLASISEDRYVSMQDICEGTDLPSQFISKIMRKLAHANLLTTARGRNGGFALMRPASEITLFDIVSVIDGDQPYLGCVLGLTRCDDRQPCSQHEHVKPIRRQVLSYMKNTCLDELSRALTQKILRG